MGQPQRAAAAAQQPCLFTADRAGAPAPDRPDGNEMLSSSPPGRKAAACGAPSLRIVICRQRAGQVGSLEIDGGVGSGWHMQKIRGQGSEQSNPPPHPSSSHEPPPCPPPHPRAAPPTPDPPSLACCRKFAAQLTPKAVAAMQPHSQGSSLRMTHHRLLSRKRVRQKDSVHWKPDPHHSTSCSVTTPWERCRHARAGGGGGHSLSKSWCAQQKWLAWQASELPGGRGHLAGPPTRPPAGRPVGLPPTRHGHQGHTPVL